MGKKNKTTRNNQGIKIIKKSNQLIESRYRFDVWESRFFLSVLAQIRREDGEFQVYRIWYKDVVKTFGIKSHQSYDLLRAAAKSIMGKSFFVTYEQNGTEREVQYHILRKIDYAKDGEAGKVSETEEYVDVTVEQEMKPFLLQLQKSFTAYDLRNVVKLGVYPLRIYELLKQYETIGERTMSVDEIKKMFEITQEYSRFPDFNRWVIKPAVKEINAYTDLTIHVVEQVKEGRRVVALRFVFRAKPAEDVRKARGETAQQPLMLPFTPGEMEDDSVTTAEAVPDEKDRLFKLFQASVLGEFGVTPSSFLELLEGRTEEEISQAVRVTKRAKSNNRIKNSVPGFFVQAVKNGYTDPKEAQSKKKQKEEEKRLQIEALKTQIEALRDEEALKLNARIKEITADNPAVTEEAIVSIRENYIAKVYITEKEESFGRALDVEDFRQDKVLRDMVKQTIFEQNKERFTDVLSEFEPRIKDLEDKIRQL